MIGTYYVTTTFVVGLAMLLLLTTTMFKSFQQSFDNATYVDAIYIYGRAIIDDNGTFVRLVGNSSDDNEHNGTIKNMTALRPPPIAEGLSSTFIEPKDVYYLAYNAISYKGCAKEDVYEILVTINQGNLCGLNPSRGWYLMETTKTTTTTTKFGFRRMALCRLNIPWMMLNYQNYTYAQDNKEVCTMMETLSP